MTGLGAAGHALELEVKNDLIVCAAEGRPEFCSPLFLFRVERAFRPHRAITKSAQSTRWRFMSSSPWKRAEETIDVAEQLQPELE